MKIRAAVHIHSEWSYDARWSLLELATLFRRRGYDAVLLAEHDRGFTQERWKKYQDACAQISTEALLLVPGIEYSDAGNVVHVTTWGSIPFLGEGRPTEELLARVSEHGGLACLAHPSRREAWQLYRNEWRPHLVGIELWNRKTDGWAPSKDAALLLEQSGLPPIGAMDFHTRKQLYPLAMTLEIEDGLSKAGVLHAIASRSFHCEAFGRGLQTFADPMWQTTLHAAEAVRRRLARSTRFLRPVRTPATKGLLSAQ